MIGCSGEDYMANILPIRLAGVAGFIGIILSPGAFAVSCDFKNGDVFTEICGYIEAGDVQTGGQLKVHVTSTTPNTPYIAL